MKTMVILGQDKVSSWLGAEIEKENNGNVLVYIDKSTGLKRVLRLLIQRRLGFFSFLKIFLADLTRKREQFSYQGPIYSNSDIITVLQAHSPSKIICYRCGLIINKKLLSMGVPILNVHVSDLPYYPGLGTIDKSIKDKAFEQNACLHVIDEGIDTGTVIKKKSYTMKALNSYKSNEDLAYQAGMHLLLECLFEK